ncbi:MAG: NAD-dependent epimerase/dehydratase family protein [Microthrixaceae bacterium]|nr:NAD-dependent epimerase/dehydratase family protein [Microthrixaceae bacterium]
MGVGLVVVTGGAGFIGSNLVHALNARGCDEVVVVDDLARVAEYGNLVGARVADHIDKDEFLELLAVRPRSRLKDLEAVLHQGACSSTMHPDPRHVIRSNYEYSRRLFDCCTAGGVRLIYASSAAVYGSDPLCVETEEHEAPLNVYGWSKLLFDRYVWRSGVGPQRPHPGSDRAQVVGLRYFNVYGRA